MSANCTCGIPRTDCPEETSCFRKIAGVLSAEEIKEHAIIVNGKADHLKPTIYDLSLGDFHYVYSSSDAPQVSERWKPIYIGDSLSSANAGWPSEYHFSRPNSTRHQELEIPALGAALIELFETVDTDTIADKNILVTGRFDLKLTYVNQGLISQQGTQIEPCYKGKMYCFVHNLSNDSIKIEKGAPVASVEFTYVSCFCGEAKRTEIIKNLRNENINKQRYDDSQTCNLNQGITNIRYFKRKRTIPDDCGLFSFPDKVTSKILNNKEFIANVSANVVAPKRWEKIAKYAVPIIVAIITFVVGPILVSNTNNNIRELESTIIELEERINDLESRPAAIHYQIPQSQGGE